MFALKQDPRLADLAVSEGRDALPEYNNPSLVPGMFPTLFPYGISGFDDRHWKTPISLQSQINLHLDSCDRSFRYHHFYVFILYNIFQCRSSHLFTHLTVSKSNFLSTAERLNCISPATLITLSCQLQAESSVMNDNPERERLTTTRVERAGERSQTIWRIV
jgi:hypothetical protein